MKLNENLYFIAYETYDLDTFTIKSKGYTLLNIDWNEAIEDFNSYLENFIRSKHSIKNSSIIITAFNKVL